MADALEEELERLPGGGTVERIRLESCVDLDGSRVRPGDALRLWVRADAPVRVLLNGHMDTVFGPDQPFQRLERLPDGRLRGPGVADMKGGLLILVESARRFLMEDARGMVGLEIVITADEEIGSPGSHVLLRAAAARNHLGLVFESALPGGGLVCRRMGTGTFRVCARGKSAHSGRNFAEGRNAVAALAALVVACHELNGRLDDSIVNVGSITGGGPVNIVPDRAEAWVNIRTGCPETAARAPAILRELIQATEARHEGVTFALDGGFARPPKAETPADAALHALWNAAETRLGLPPSGKGGTGGSSDGNLLGAAGLPHLDGVGIQGGALHSEEEFALPDSVPPQIAKTVAFLNLLAEDPGLVQRPPLGKAS